jgi:NTE family protein
MASEAVLASACLPLLHHTIEIDGEAYWDGGYAANPPVLPLTRASECEHVLIVQVTPTMSDRVPKTARDIARRLEQIQFNATLNSEVEALKYGKMIGASRKLRRLRIGRISARKSSKAWRKRARATSIGTSSSVCASGRVAADLWLRQDMPQSASRLIPLAADEAAS